VTVARGQLLRDPKTVVEGLAGHEAAGPQRQAAPAGEAFQRAPAGDAQHQVAVAGHDALSVAPKRSASSRPNQATWARMAASAAPPSPRSMASATARC